MNKILVTACLLLLMAACSTGTKEYIRIVPNAGQSIQELFTQTNQLVAEWEEFTQNFNCSDPGGNFFHVYKIRPELAKHYYGISISVLFDPKNELLFLEYSHQESHDSMAPETKELYDKVLSRLKNELSADRIAQLDISNNNSNEWQLLHLLFNGGGASQFSCTQPK